MEFHSCHFSPNPKALHDLQHVAPIYSVEGFLYVKLHEKGWYFHFLKSPDGVLNVEEVVLYASMFDECTLAFGDQLVKVRSKSIGQQF